jgi:ring-1,2-phenylacetyl-CoA epoxidase subunit PaaB
VFQQEREGTPHELIGSVQAADDEMALYNARSVFARRLTCTSLWVARETRILTVTAEVIEIDPGWAERHIGAEQGEMATYHVFGKLQPRGAHIHLGDIDALSPGLALLVALERYSKPHPLVWMVIPAQAVTRSRPEDIAAMLDERERKSSDNG